MVNKKVINMIITVALALVIAVVITLSVVYTPRVLLDIDQSEISNLNNGIKLFNGGEYGEFDALGKVDANGAVVAHEFKIVAFTDTHLNSRGYTNNRTVKNMLKAINTERPDLVVFDGDNALDAANVSRYTQIAQAMEAYGLYWCFVLGNHEGEGEGVLGRAETVKLMETYPHCLVKSDDGGVSGEGNYVVNLLGEGGALAKSLIFMDSGLSSVTTEEMEQFNIDGGYDFLKADQIEWYKNTVDRLQEAGDARSMLFLHIPLCEYPVAYDEAVQGIGGSTLLCGERRETECNSRYNSGMFDAIMLKGSTEAVFAGHDHVNDYVVNYKGVYLGYVQSSGYSTYGSAKVKGYTRLTVKTDKSLVIEQNLYDDMK